MPPTSRCGLALPLPANFDTAAHMLRPADIPAPPDMDLQDINAENVRREKANKASLSFTRAYAAAAASPAGITVEDVGAALEPFFEYSDGDKALLVGSKEAVDATGPLPVYMTLFVAGARIKSAESDAADKAKREQDRAARDAEKNKAAGPIFGTLLMQNPRLISSAVTATIQIPDLWHVSLLHKIYFPIHWWSDKILRQATDFPHSFPSATISGVQTSAFVTPPTVNVLNVARALKELGEEDWRNMTPGLWRQSSINQLESFKRLCPAIVPGDPSSPTHTFASEYAQHVTFFASVDCFEDLEMFPVWYPAELKLRYAIFHEGIFDRALYESRYDIAISTYENSRAGGSSSGHKRAAGDNGNTSSAKQPRGARAHDARDRRSAPPGAREGSAPSDRPPACLICAGPHNALAHPAAKIAFDDGGPHFSALEGRDLRTARPFRGKQCKSLCIVYNIGRTCVSEHADDRIHVCSLCGGDHAALSRNSACKRVRAGALVP
ncbi:hypothetical protein GGX14DRAFT_678821 [Mycena pura]|uniref:Uncharacterized protein n=1 Tax=Mycena pura TaxID=153505 RepID=A0AAD6UTM4_9AGAR|nr:hypothetical protein GGX14DRAFT_678821 [Mycena pura]